MKGISQGRYTREFRQETVELIAEQGLSLPEAARLLFLAPSTLSYWDGLHKAGIMDGAKMRYIHCCETGTPHIRHGFAGYWMQGDS
ncbi:transposase [Chloroflexota bacterium]